MVWPYGISMVLDSLAVTRMANKRGQHDGGLCYWGIIWLHNRVTFQSPRRQVNNFQKGQSLISSLNLFQHRQITASRSENVSCVNNMRYLSGKDNPLGASKERESSVMFLLIVHYLSLTTMNSQRIPYPFKVQSWRPCLN
jgi:hypothetical protein